MSHVIDDSSTQKSSPPPQAGSNATSASWLESFVQNFFQEKNIKWMLVVGAAIVFGSSLMLVTKAWPEWSIALKYLTIVGYTGVIFGAAELSRRRLKLSATYHVLQALTLLLLPVCFLSLTWLSSGTAVQSSLHSVRNLGLLIPAIALLWLASTTILDHWLRGRQTTFLVSFGLLCIAGAVPEIVSPVGAFVFMAACWAVLTAGVVKVNRHTFWLAQQHQLPRIFGFLPIAMLGLQFVTLVSVKAAALPTQWIGFALVMVAATVLMTTRTVADVFRRRTGNLVRPLPMAIVLPLLIGLVAAVGGLALSLVGFSYVGETTYAVIPTAIVAAALMALVAKDTRHPVFVWASLAAITLAYQCAPTLFADLVQMARSATADAINQPRVPLSLYGLTYLPLLGTLSILSRRLAKQDAGEFASAIKRYVTLVSGVLFSLALADLVLLKFISPFLVSTVNAIVFLGYAILWQDRRYALPSIVALVIACTTSIPALSQMQYSQLSIAWVPTILAGLALLMNVTTWPDRWINRIALNPDDRLMLNADGSDRNFVQLIGCVLAIGMGIHWVVATSLSFDTALSRPLMWQFGLLMLALVRYTIRNMHYASATSVWILAAYALLRWASGLGLEAAELVALSTYGLVAVSLVSFGLLRWLTSKMGASSLNEMRCRLGWDAKTFTLTPLSVDSSGFRSRIVAFALPLFDLTSIALCSLVAMVFIPAVIIQHAVLLGAHSTAFAGFGWSTPLILCWLFVLAIVNRNRAFGMVAAMLLPLVVSSALITSGTLVGATNLLLTWAIVQCGLTIVSHQLLLRRESRGESENQVSGIQAVVSIGLGWSFALLALSCVAFDWPMRMVASICFVSLAISCIGRWDAWKQTNLAILANINLFLATACWKGCTGWLLPGFAGNLDVAAVPFVFMVGCLSVLFFERRNRFFDQVLAGQWAMSVRIAIVPLAAMSFLQGPLAAAEIAAVTIGMCLLIATESLQAIKQRQEGRVWSACFIGGVLSLFLYQQHVISLGVGISQLVLLTLSVVGLSVASLSQRYETISVFRRPMSMIGLSLPAVVACLAVLREFSGLSSFTALNALSLMIAAGIYFQQAAARRRPNLCLPALVIANAGVFLLWKSLEWNSPELYLVPIGISILGLAEVMKKELPKSTHKPLHYIGLLTVLCSPLPEVIGGSWGHIFALMLLSVCVILAAIGLRMRSLVYAGSAFLLTDLVAMVIRSTIHNVNLLWICGLVLGIGVIALAAFCENHREKLLARIRLLSAELATWN